MVFNAASILLIFDPSLGIPVNESFQGGGVFVEGGVPILGPSMKSTETW